MIIMLTTHCFAAEQSIIIIMGFADLSIADIAAEYDLSVETVFHLCDQLGVTYNNQQTNLALEDAKAIISQILSLRSDSLNKSKKILFQKSDRSF